MEEITTVEETTIVAESTARALGPNEWEVHGYTGTVSYCIVDDNLFTGTVAFLEPIEVQRALFDPDGSTGTNDISSFDVYPESVGLDETGGWFECEFTPEGSEKRYFVIHYNTETRTIYLEDYEPAY